MQLWVMLEHQFVKKQHQSYLYHSVLRGRLTRFRLLWAVLTQFVLSQMPDFLAVGTYFNKPSKNLLMTIHCNSLWANDTASIFSASVSLMWTLISKIHAFVCSKFLFIGACFGVINILSVLTTQIFWRTDWFSFNWCHKPAQTTMKGSQSCIVTYGGKQDHWNETKVE